MNVLKKVERAAKKATASRELFEESVREAYDAGHSLRPIGEAAGISHEQVRRIVQT